MSFRHATSAKLKSTIALKRPTPKTSWKLAVGRWKLTRASCLCRNFGNPQRMQVLQKRLRGVAIELRIGRLDAEEEAIARRACERPHVEHRVIRHRQPVQREHPD